MLRRQAVPGYSEFCEKLGAIFDVASRCRNYSKVMLPNLRAWIIPPVELSQVRIFYSESGTALGYFTWAYLSESSVDQLVAGKMLVPNIHQWAEGDQFWIMDFVALDGSLREIRTFIKKVVLPEVQAINYVRRRSGVGPVKLMRVVAGGKSPL